MKELKSLIGFIFILTRFTYEVYGNAVPATAQFNTENKCYVPGSNIINLKCSVGKRIRILTSFYSINEQCSKNLTSTTCHTPTNEFEGYCNGQTNCNIEFKPILLIGCNSYANFMTIRYECIPEKNIHSICHRAEDSSIWGTLSTRDFASPSTDSNVQSLNDCWCKLTASNNQRILLSIISFSNDQDCLSGGLYLQSTRNRSTECTRLQKGHYYISSTQDLYINFYSQEKNDKKLGDFWLIYEASDAESNIHLKCEETKKNKEIGPNNSFFQTLQKTSLTTTTNTIFFQKNKLNVDIQNMNEIVSVTPAQSQNKSTIDVLSFKSKFNFTPQYKRLTMSTKPKTVSSTIMSTTASTTSTTTSTATSTITSTTISATISYTKRISTSTLAYTPLIISSKMVRYNRTIHYKLKSISTQRLSTKLTSHFSPSTTKKNYYTNSHHSSTKLRVRKTKKTTSTKKKKKIPDITTRETTTRVSFKNDSKSLLSFSNYKNKELSLLSKPTSQNISKLINPFNETTPHIKDDQYSMEITNNTKKENLNKTQMTIIIACVASAALLTLINLIIYVCRKLIKKSSNKSGDTNTSDPLKKSYDILPGVGEIVLWAAKDKRGYLIDTNGSWAKIDGQRWLRDNMAVLHNTYKKASLAYRNRFRKKEDKPKTKNNEILFPKRSSINLNQNEFKVVYSLPPLSEVSEFGLSNQNSRTSSGIYLNDQIYEQNNEVAYQSNHGSVFWSTNELNANEFFQAPVSNNEESPNSLDTINSSESIYYLQNNHLCSPNSTEKLDNTSIANISNKYEDYSQVCLECSFDTNFDKSSKIIDQASDEITKHFNRTLNEINSIIKSEEQSEKKDTRETNLKCSNKVDNETICLKTVDMIKNQGDEIECPTNTANEMFESKTKQSSTGFKNEKISKIEETIRKNQSKLQNIRDHRNENWRKRQSIAEANEYKIPPPPSHSAPQIPRPLDFFETKLNIEDFNKLVDAIEQLELSKFFKAENIKTMTDKQVYEALVEHARDQKISLPSIFLSSKGINTTSSVKKDIVGKIVEEEDDLPIIIRNLHSVKSLKHFFEIRTKPLSESAPIHLLQNCIGQRASNYIEPNTKIASDLHKNKTVPMNESSAEINATSPQQHSAKQVVNENTKEILTKQIDAISSQSVKRKSPIAPPLPDFLKKSSLNELKNNIKPSLKNNDRQLEINIGQEMNDTFGETKNCFISPNSNKSHGDILSLHKHYYKHHLGQPDLHHRLIREIQNKSLERSRKDSNIGFDEQGNLVNKSSISENELHHSSKNGLETFSTNYKFSNDCPKKNEISSYITRSMLSEARAKLEAFSSKFPTNQNINDGTSYLNNLNFELTRTKICKAFLNNETIFENSANNESETFDSNQNDYSRSKF